MRHQDGVFVSSPTELVQVAGANRLRIVVDSRGRNAPVLFAWRVTKPRRTPALSVGLRKLDCCDTVRKSFSFEVLTFGVQELQNLVLGPAVLLERIPSEAVQLLDDVLDRNLADVQLELKPGHYHVHLMAADGLNAGDSSRYTGVATSASQPVDVQYESLIVWRAFLDVACIRNRLQIRDRLRFVAGFCHCGKLQVIEQMQVYQ